MLKNICRIFSSNLEKKAYSSCFTLFATKPISNFMFSSLKAPENIHMDLDKYIKSENMIKKLKSRGIQTLFPIQAHTFEHIYSGKDIIAGDKTGSGKTIAFTLPVIERMRNQGLFKNKKGIKFVILAPTRELVVQIATEIDGLKQTRFQYKVLPVFGGSPVSLNERELARNPDILVGTPGRMTDLIERGLLNFSNVESVCVDEADYMFDIGFKQTIGDILREISKKTTQACQYMCFSATLNNEVALLTSKFMKQDKVTIKMYDENTKKTPVTIKHYFMTVSEFDKIDKVKQIIRQKSNGGRVIVFVNTKKQGQRLSDELGIDNVCLNGDVEQRVRFRRLEKFKEGQVKVLVATDVAARGLDIPNVELIIHYDQPNYLDSYIHRSGRTGRAGRDGVSVMLISNRSQQSMMKDIEKKLEIKVQRIKSSQLPPLEVQKNLQENKDTRTSRSFEKIQQPQIQYSQTQFILFDNKDKLSGQNLQEQLKLKGINFTKFKQIFSSKSSTKFYIIEVLNQNQGDTLLRQTFGQGNLRFNRSKLNTNQPAKKSYGFGK